MFYWNNTYLKNEVQETFSSIDTKEYNPIIPLDVKAKISTKFYCGVFN